MFGLFRNNANLSQMPQGNRAQALGGMHRGGFADVTRSAANGALSMFNQQPQPQVQAQAQQQAIAPTEDHAERQLVDMRPAPSQRPLNPYSRWMSSPNRPLTRPRSWE